LRSPPEHSETFFCCCEPEKLYFATYALEETLSPPTSSESLPSVISSKIVLLSSSASGAGQHNLLQQSSRCRLCLLGLFLAGNNLNSVVFTIPFGPITPTIAFGGSSNEQFLSAD
jgi:hypothetical protein